MNNETKSAIKDYLADKKITQGLTQAQHCGIILHILSENGLIQVDDDGNDTENKKKGFTLLYELMNGSALRQKLEDLEMLTKTGRKRGVDAASVAGEFC